MSNQNDWIIRNQIRDFCKTFENKTFFISHENSAIIGKYFEINDAIIFKQTKYYTSSLPSMINETYISYKVVLRLYNVNKNKGIDATKYVKSFEDLKNYFDSFCLEEIV